MTPSTTGCNCLCRVLRTAYIRLKRSRQWSVRRYVVLLSALVLASICLPHPAWGQEDGETVQTSRSRIDLRLSGIIQPRFSTGWTSSEGDADQRAGFGMRRARLAAEARIGEHVGLFLQTELATGDVFGIDAYAFYELERLQLRLGRFVGAQPRAFNPTSSVRIDAVDRAVIAERWGQGTIGGDGRDFGFEARYEDEQGTLAFFLHNGDGNWSRLRGNYRGGLSSLPVTEGIDRTGLAFSISGHREVQTVDGLEIGGFVGYNGSRNPNTEIAGTGRGYGTASVHAYWGVHPGSQPFRLKADLIAIRYEEIEALNIFERSVAFALLGAARAREATEIFARYEYESRLDVPAPDHFFTLGAHLSTSALRGAAFHHERLTLGYGVIPAADNGPSQHLVVLQAQIVF